MAREKKRKIDRRTLLNDAAIVRADVQVYLSRMNAMLERVTHSQNPSPREVLILDRLVRLGVTFTREIRGL